MAALCLPLVLRAEVDFSGMWKMDPARSESAHQAVPIGPVTIVFKNISDGILIETARAERAGAAVQREILTFKLDGSESIATDINGTRVNSRAHWDGNKLVTGTTRTIDESTITTLQVYSLDDTGREMTVRNTLTVQHGYQFAGAKNTGSGTDVFIKAKPAATK